MRQGDFRSPNSCKRAAVCWGGADLGPGLQGGPGPEGTGLERSDVIANDLEELGASVRAMILYAGLSRAKTLLIPLVPRACKKRYSELVAGFGRRISRT